MPSIRKRFSKKAVTSILLAALLIALLLAPSAFAALRGGSSGGGGDGSAGGGGSTGGGGRGGGFVLITPTTTGEIVKLTDYTTALIKFNGGSYTFVMVTAFRDAVDITVANKQYHILVGKSETIDINNDGKRDIRISLVSVIHNLATFVVKLEQTTPPVSAPSPAQKFAEPLPTADAVAVPEAAPSAALDAGDFVQVTRESTQLGGMSINNKLISAALLLIAGILIFKIWRRSRIAAR